MWIIDSIMQQTHKSKSLELEGVIMIHDNVNVLCVCVFVRNNKDEMRGTPEIVLMLRDKLNIGLIG